MMRPNWFVSAGLFIFAGLLVGGVSGCKSSESSKQGFEVSESSLNPSLLKAQSEDISDFRVECPANEKDKDKEKVCVLICHRPPGNPIDAAHEKVLPLEALNAHLNHGRKGHQPDYLADTLGPCEPADDNDDGGDDGSDDGSDDGDNNDDDGNVDDGDDDGSTDDGSTDDGSDDDSTDDGSTDDGSDDGSTDDGSTDDGSDDDSTDDGSTDDGDGDYQCSLYDADGNPLPCWCEENLDIDADCDGIHDEGGYPIY